MKMKSASFYIFHILFQPVDIEKPWVKLGQVGHQVVMAAQNQLTFVKTFTFNDG